MSNPFDKYDSVEAPTSLNPFDRFDSSNGFNTEELDSITKSNSVQAQEYVSNSVGLSAVPVDIAKGLTTFFLGLPPQAVGSSLVQTGELIKGEEAHTITGTFKKSFTSRLLDDSLSGKYPDIFDVTKALWGAEKDSLLVGFAGNKAPQRLVNAGNALIKDNQAMLESMNLVPKGAPSVSYDIGLGLGSVAFSVGTTVITKNPTLAAGFMGWLVNSQDYKEARKTKNPEEATAIAFTSASGQGLVELIGGKYFLSATKASSRLATILARTAGQGLEEGTQAAIEETVKGVSGVRKTELAEKMQNVMYQAMIGVIVGAPVSTTVTLLESNAKDIGISKEDARKVAKNLHDDGDVLIDNVTFLLDNERTPLVNKTPAHNEVVSAANEVLIQAIEGSKLTGKDKVEDPKQAANLLLRSPSILLDRKVAIDELLKSKRDFTIAELRDLLNDVKVKEVVKPNVMDEDRILDLMITQEETRKAAATQVDEKIQNVISRETKDLKDKVLEKDRVTFLRNKIKEISPKIDSTLEELLQREAEGLTTKSINNKLTKLTEEYNSLKSELNRIKKGKHITVEQVGEKDITLKAKSLFDDVAKKGMELKKESDRSFNKGMILAKKEGLAARGYLVSLINKSPIPKDNKSVFINDIKNVSSAEQLPAVIENIQKKITAIHDSVTRNNFISLIKRVVSKAKESSVIAVDYVDRITNIAGAINLSNISDRTKKDLQAFLDFLAKNPDAPIPDKIKSKLASLEKIQASDLSTAELSKVYNKMLDYVKQGKKKLALFEQQREKAIKDSLSSLKKNNNTVFESKEKKRLDLSSETPSTNSVFLALQNAYTKALNKNQQLNLVNSPMDVMFDMLDANQGYKGENYRVFKKQTDIKYTEYLNLKDSVKNPVNELIDKNKLTEHNLNRIGAYAALQQDSGRDKLLFTGYSEKELDNLVLNAKEMEVYQAMREKMDSLVPQIEYVMRTVYNQPFEKVNNYFSFHTDFDAQQELAIYERGGDNIDFQANRKNVQKKFTISRTGGEQAIKINAGEIFNKHIDEAAYLVTMGEHIRTLTDVAKTPDYAMLVGNQGQELVVSWIDLLARRGKAQGHVHTIDIFRKNVSAAVMAFKVSTMFIQLSGFVNGSAFVGQHNMAYGKMKMLTDPNWREFVRNNMPEIRDRIGNDPNYTDLGGTGLLKDIQQVGYYAMTRMDKLTAVAIGIGGYRKYMVDNNLEIDLSSPNQEAIQFAQLMVRRSIAGAAPKDLPLTLSKGAFSGNVSIDKIIFHFQTFMFNRWSSIKHDLWRVGVKGGKTNQALNIATFITLSTMMEVALFDLSKEAVNQLVEMITGKKVKNAYKDKEFGERLLSQSLSSVPYVSHAASVLQYNSNPVPIVSYSDNIIREVSAFSKSKRSDKQERHAINALILSTGLFGIPGALQTKQLVDKSLKSKE
jgi:hypothetical protein